MELGHPDDCTCSMCVLRELDETTEWELPGDLPADWSGDDSVVDMPTTLDFPGGPEEVDNIIDCVSGMNANGDIESLVVIVNCTDKDQLLLTNLEDNQLIMGTLSIASHNWHSSQLALQEWEDSEGGEEVEE